MVKTKEKTAFNPANPADKVEQWPIEKLIPYARNSRTHSAEQVAQIAASIREWGFTTAILVDEDGGIIAGHGRVMAARKLGIKQIPTMVAAGWTDAQKRAYVIADNKLALNAGWDNEMLHSELQDLSEIGFDVELTGFTLDEIDDLVEADVVMGLTDEDNIPEVPMEAITKHGDIWLLGNHRLMCGDSTSVIAVERLMDGQKADMVFTDPPYGIDYSGGRTQVVAKKSYGKIKNDTLEGVELGALITNAFYSKKEGGDIYICVSPIMQKPFLDVIEKYKPIDAVIVWDKKVPGLGYMAHRRQCEFILFVKGIPFRKGDRSDLDLWQINRDSGQDYAHGTQKPVALPIRAITNSSKSGDMVLDLFGGSGSTLIACEKIQRKCFMMELDEKFCDVIVKRWQEFTGKEVIHAETGIKFNAMGSRNA